jgi:hypothetical protein
MVSMLFFGGKIMKFTDFPDDSGFLGFAKPLSGLAKRRKQPERYVPFGMHYFTILTISYFYEIIIMRNNIMRFILEEYHRNTPDVDLIEDIKTVSKKLQKNTVTMTEYNEFGKFSSSTLQRRFGSWFNVLELAGLEPSRSEINIPDDNLFKNIENIVH